MDNKAARIRRATRARMLEVFPQLADVASFLRSSWGAQAAPVSAFDVSRWRGGIDD